MVLARRTLLAASGLLWLAGCTPRPALILSDNDRGTIDRIAQYLDGLKRFQAGFIQTGAFGDGTGTVWLDRPGHLRIAYAGTPAKTLVAANGRVVIYDDATGGTTTMPVSRTPLGLLLTPNITLRGDVTVTGFRSEAGRIAVTIEKTDSPGDGSLTLYLAPAPLTLIGVLVTDGNQRPLMIHLSPLTLDLALPPDLFQYPGPAAGS